MQDNSNINTIHLGSRSKLCGRSQCHLSLLHCWATHKNKSNSGKFEAFSCNLYKLLYQKYYLLSLQNRHQISGKCLSQTRIQYFKTSAIFQTSNIFDWQNIFSDQPNLTLISQHFLMHQLRRCFDHRDCSKLCLILSLWLRL